MNYVYCTKIIAKILYVTGEKKINFLKCVICSQYCVDSKVTKRWAGQSVVQYPAEAREFLFSKISGLVLELNQPPIQWILWALSRE